MGSRPPLHGPSRLRRILFLVLSMCFILSLFGRVEAARDPGKIKLAKLSKLILRNGQMTTGRRGSPVPQLKCVGGDAKGLFEVDVMVCKNLGSDYGDDDVSWSCTAEIPGYFKLGSTDVLCEGYDSPEDPYVLRGSCGVEYRLQLTDAGYEKFGYPSGDSGSTGFKILMFALLAIWIVFAVGAWWRGNPQGGINGGGTNGGGWGGGGGGGGGDGGFNDPPPPYPGTGPKTYPSSSSTSGGGQGWRPGFWTGAATGAAASHLLGSRGRDDRRDRGYAAGGSRWGSGDSSMAGPSRSGGWGGGSSSGGGASRSSTGFGQTRRR